MYTAQQIAAGYEQYVNDLKFSGYDSTTIGFQAVGTSPAALQPIALAVNNSLEKMNQSAGSLKLIVPLITIVPIPYIAIDTVDVAFRFTDDKTYVDVMLLLSQHYHFDFNPASALEGITISQESSVSLMALISSIPTTTIQEAGA